MSVSKEELLHIANLSHLEVKDSEIEKYLKNLDDILDYAKILEKAPIGDLDETIGANDNINVFRKDEIKNFDNINGLLENAPGLENNMYKIPKVLQ